MGEAGCAVALVCGNVARTTAFAIHKKSSAVENSSSQVAVGHKEMAPSVGLV